MANFICIDCGYRFQSEALKKRCPYCASEKIEKEKSAKELVDNANVE